MKIGDRIRAERERQGLTQDELAKRMGYKYRSSVNKIEGKESLPTSKLQRVADALGVSPATLTGWDDPNDSYAVKELLSDPELHFLTEAKRTMTPERFRDYVRQIRAIYDSISG